MVRATGAQAAWIGTTVVGVGSAVLGLFLDRGGWTAVLFVLSVLALAVGVAMATRLPSRLSTAVCGAVAGVPLVLVLTTQGEAVLAAVERFAEIEEPVQIPKPPCSPSPEPSAHPTPAAVDASFTEPQALEYVPRRGVNASGEVQGAVPRGSAIWLFVRSPDEGGVHYVTDKISTDGASWALGTGEVGDSDGTEQGKLFVLELVLAEPAASRRIERAARNNEYGWNPLPEGSRILDRRAVRRR
jgi:hypothetical protein